MKSIKFFKKMEQISFTCSENENYDLNIYYENNLYECEINKENFDSDFVEIDMFESVVQEGLKPNITNKIDENLKISTTFVPDYVQDTLTMNLTLDYKKGKLKKRTEKYSFIMNKKVIDSQATFESVLRGIKKSFNIPLIARETTNIFVNIDYEEEQVYYHENGNKISLVSKITVKPNFLEFIMTQDKEMHAFFTNRLHSQEMINEMIAEKIQQYYHSEKMIEFIIQFMTNTFYTNFVQILNQGQKILFNVDPKKSSKG